MRQTTSGRREEGKGAKGRSRREWWHLSTPPSVWLEAHNLQPYVITEPCHVMSFKDQSMPGWVCYLGDMVWLNEERELARVLPLSVAEVYLYYVCRFPSMQQPCALHAANLSHLTADRRPVDNLHWSSRDGARWTASTQQRHVQCSRVCNNNDEFVGWSWVIWWLYAQSVSRANYRYIEESW